MAFGLPTGLPLPQTLQGGLHPQSPLIWSGIRRQSDTDISRFNPRSSNSLQVILPKPDTSTSSKGLATDLSLPHTLQTGGGVGGRVGEGVGDTGEGVGDTGEGVDGVSSSSSSSSSPSQSQTQSHT